MIVNPQVVISITFFFKKNQWPRLILVIAVHVSALSPSLAVAHELSCHTDAVER